MRVRHLRWLHYARLLASVCEAQGLRRGDALPYRVWFGAARGLLAQDDRRLGMTCTMSQIEATFGGWPAFLNLEGLRTANGSERPRADYSQYAIVARFELARAALGRVPKMKELVAFGPYSRPTWEKALGLCTPAERATLRSPVEEDGGAPFLRRAPANDSELLALFSLVLGVYDEQVWIEAVTAPGEPIGMTLVTELSSGSHARVRCAFSGSRELGSGVARIGFKETPDVAVALERIVQEGRSCGFGLFEHVVDASAQVPLQWKRPERSAPAGWIRPPQNERETAVCFLRAATQWGRMRVHSVERREVEPFVDLVVDLWDPEVVGWRRCRIEVKYRTSQWNKEEAYQDLVVAWKDDAAERLPVPVLALSDYFERFGKRDGPPLLQLLPDLRKRCGCVDNGVSDPPRKGSGRGRSKR